MFYNTDLNLAVEGLEFLLYTQETQRSNLNPKTDYPSRFSMGTFIPAGHGTRAV
jgi:hypothetical protein